MSTRVPAMLQVVDPDSPQQTNPAVSHMPDLTDMDRVSATPSTALSDAPTTTPHEMPEIRRPSSADTTPSDASSLSTYMRERPRNRSPYGYSRSHLRSQSHASALAPPMSRTRSSPSFTTVLSTFSATPGASPLRPSSPNLRSSGHHSPRRSLEDIPSPHPAPATPSFMDIESIAEDSELDLSLPTNTIPPTSLHSAAFSRSNSGRRRPSSPLHYQLSPSPGPAPPVRTPSPGLGNIKFNEPFPSHAQPHQSSTSLNTLYSSSSSMSASMYGARDSMPSTPTSVRSRSPSVSSLETIPDSPDAEEAATEAYNLAQLKAAADAAEAQAELEAGGGAAGDKSKSGGRTQRKRWSVCGAERRTDFEMETIWED